MKPVIIIAIAFVLLIPVSTYAMEHNEIPACVGCSTEDAREDALDELIPVLTKKMTQ